MTTKQRRIGQFTVPGIGLGAMPLSSGGSAGRPERDDAIATIHAALDAGVRLIDTADIYAPSWDTVGHNESIVGEALKTWTGDRSEVVVATKGGITRSMGEQWGRDGSREHLLKAADESRERLGMEVLDIYYWHRPDRYRRYAEAVETSAELKANGVVREIGISNANIEELELALEILGEGELAVVQNEFSPKFNHTSYPELKFCAERGITFVPWSPLGGTGGGAQAVAKRFPAIIEVAQAHEASPQQVILAWELALGKHVLPIPGASRAESIVSSFAALNLDLSADEVEQLSDALLQR